MKSRQRKLKVIRLTFPDANHAFLCTFFFDLVDKLSGLFVTNSPDYYCYDFTPRRMRTSSLSFGGFPYISTPTR